MATKAKQVIALSAPVKITAGECEEGKKAGPAKFTSTFYTGGAMSIEGWDLPVVIDLAGLKPGKVLVANLDHDASKRVGNFAVANDGKSLVANGTASAATPARDEVVNSAKDGYEWQSSLEVNPEKVETVKAGKAAKANGQEFEGPIYVTRVGTLKGFAFVSHGADDNTTVTIAASAASKEKTMKAEVKTWIKAMLPSVDIEALTDDEVANLEAQHAGLHPEKPKKKLKLDDEIEAKQAEVERVDGITDIALNACDKRPYDINAIKELANKAIEGKWGVDKFRMELLEASLPPAHTVFRTKRDERLNSKVIEAAICQAGRLSGIENLFDDQTLQAAHDQFKGGIGLKQLMVLGAQANGYHSTSFDVNIEVQRAAFGLLAARQIQASGFSTISLPNVFSNTANKFIREGWNAIDQTPLRIAAIRSVRNFQQITTVSLTGALQFEKVAADGEIKHGTLGELTYTNQVETFARMLAITRQDMINDDLGALTAIPRRLGRGGMLMLNDIFWTEFLNNGSFFTSGNANVNTGVADMTSGGLSATEVIFMAQTDPDGKPLGTEPRILLVPTALKSAAKTLMTSEKMLGTAGPDGNPWRERFRVESSPSMSNSAYTGYSAAAWYMLADPNDMPVIEIAALNGRVEPTVETADADFNVLGVQMRGYSDVGVNLQEYRGGVRADGGAS